MESKKYNVKGSARQLTAIEKLIENGGNVSKAMKEAGYSQASAKNPKVLTESSIYADLLEAYLPDDMMLRALSDDIEKKEGNRTSELQLGFKLKGRMTEKVDVTTKGESLNNFNDEEKNALLALLND